MSVKKLIIINRCTLSLFKILARTFICLWTPHTQNPSGYIVIFFHERKTKQLLTSVFKASLNYWSSIETWNSPIHWLMLIELSNDNNFLLATCKWLPSFLFINHCIFVFNLLFIKRFSLLIKRWKTYNEIQYNYPKYTSYVKLNFKLFKGISFYHLILQILILH